MLEENDEKQTLFYLQANAGPHSWPWLWLSLCLECLDAFTIMVRVMSPSPESSSALLLNVGSAPHLLVLLAPSRRHFSPSNAPCHLLTHRANCLAPLPGSVTSVCGLSAEPFQVGIVSSTAVMSCPLKWHHFEK